MLGRWLQVFAPHVSLPQALGTLHRALSRGVKVDALQCQTCKTSLQEDAGPLQHHTCPTCQITRVTPVAIVSNPFAALLPKRIGAKTYLARLPEEVSAAPAAKESGQEAAPAVAPLSANASSLAVEPHFLDEVH